MNQRGIGTGVHYLSVPEHPYYQQRFGWKPEQWPNAMRTGRQTVSVPLSAGLTDSDVERTLTQVRSVCHLYKRAMPAMEVSRTLLAGMARSYKKLPSCSP